MYIVFLGSSSLGRAACSFFAHPLRVLNDIFDPSKATSARPRKLGLRPQTVRVRPGGRFLRPRRVPKNIVRDAPGTCGVGVNLFDSAFPLRRVALSERRAEQCCIDRSCKNKTRQTRPNPFSKGEGGVMRDLHIRAEVQYISLHAARPSDELPKKTDAQVGQLPTEIIFRKQTIDVE